MCYSRAIIPLPVPRWPDTLVYIFDEGHYEANLQKPTEIK